MNTSEAQVGRPPMEAMELKRVTGELVGEAVGSIAVIALAIAGLAGAWPVTIAAVAAIVLGAAYLIQGGVLNGVEKKRYREWASTEFLGGLTGVILGILALLGTSPEILLSAAAIVFGVTLLFSHLAEEMFGSRSLVGIGAVVLGILAVAGLSQVTLVLVALLSLGAMELFAGLEDSVEIATRRKHRA